MAKRFTATDIWSEDWFIDMPNEYKLFWYYMLSHCDHAGLFKVNLRSFRGLIEVNVDPNVALNLINSGKNRIREVTKSLWLIEDFFFYQYGSCFNINNRVHNSIYNEYKKHGIELTSIRGLKEVILDLKEGVKDKDKDITVKQLVNTNGIHEKNDERMVVKKMMEVWKRYKPNYPQDDSSDYPACLQFAHKIADVKGWRQVDVTGTKENDVINSWGKIVAFIVSDTFFKTQSLKSLVGQFQTIFQKMEEANASNVNKPLTKKQKSREEIDREMEEWVNSENPV